VAMGKCRECSKSVSSEATTCPHCGVPRPVAPPRPKTPEAEAAERGVGIGCLVVVLLVFGWCYFSPSDDERALKERNRRAAAEAATDSAAATNFYAAQRNLSPALLGKLSSEACAGALPAIAAAPESKTKKAWYEACQATISAVPPLSRDEVLAARQRFTIKVLSFDAETQIGNEFPYANRVRVRVTNGSKVRLPFLTVRTNRWGADGTLLGWSRAPAMQVGHVLPGTSVDLDFAPLGHLPSVSRITVEIERSIKSTDEGFFDELKSATASNPKSRVTPTPIPLGMLADSVLALKGKARATRQVGSDVEGLLVEWEYPDMTLLFGRREANGVTAYRVLKVTPRQ
jgi:hypothetical protein